MPVGHAVDVVVGRVDRAGDVAGVPLVALAHVEDLHARRRSARAARRRSSARSRSTGSALLAPAGHAAGEVPGERARRPTAAASSAASRASSSSRPTSTTALVAARRARRASSRSPPASAVMQTRARDVRLVELELGAHVDHERAAGAAWSTWRGVSGCAVDARRRSGPRLSATMCLEVRRLRAQRRRSRAATNSSSSAIAEQLVVRALEADRRRDLHVHPRPAAERAAEVARARPRRCRGSASSCRAASGRCRARPRPCRRRGRAGRCRRRTACRRSAPPTARRRARVSISANAVCSGRCPGVCSARTLTLPSSSSQPSSNGLVVVVGSGARGGCGSSRRSPRPAGRGRRRGRRGCGSRGCARCARRGSARAAGTRRCRAAGRPPPRRPRSRRRSR